MANNQQVKLTLRNMNKEQTQKSEGTNKVELSLEMATLYQFTISLGLILWTEIEPHTAITTQPEESKEKQ